MYNFDIFFEILFLYQIYNFML